MSESTQSAPIQDVFFNRDAIAEVSKATIDDLKKTALASPRKRARLCLHHSQDKATHEMILVFHRSTYIQPHRHPSSKSESYHVIEGRMAVVFFDEAGRVTRNLELGEYASGQSPLYRLSESVFHMPIPTSEWLVYHETFTGPFDKDNDVEYASWAPPETDRVAAQNYVKLMLDQAKGP